MDYSELLSNIAFQRATAFSKVGFLWGIVDESIRKLYKPLITFNIKWLSLVTTCYWGRGAVERLWEASNKCSTVPQTSI